MQPRPKKSLGQHFLTNPQICARIACLLDPEPEDRIIEIGPGPGALTSAILACPHEKLLLIEKDGYWAEERRKAGGAEIVAGDALVFRWEEWPPHWKIIGNLPYNIASPLIWDICGRYRFARAVFMTQLEVAQRICATPGKRQYGALSVWIQNHATPKLEMRLAPGAFFPPPKVESAVISLVPLSGRPLFPEKLNFLLKICFQQRRKQLASIFRKHELPLAALENLGIPLTARPEELSPEEFRKLAELAAAVGLEKADNHQ